MTHTVDDLMALAEEYADAECRDYLTGEASSLWYGENLRKALTEALDDSEIKLQDIAAYIGVGGHNGATPKQLAERICAEFDRLDSKARAAQQVREPYDKTEMNAFAHALYDAKMLEGNHGHYETLFHVVHKSIERAHGIGGDK
jgi:hypothetical protein